MMRTLFCGLVIIGKTLLLAAAITADNLNFVDPLIGTEGTGSEYGGMQPYTCVPFGSWFGIDFPYGIGV